MDDPESAGAFWYDELSLTPELYDYSFIVDGLTITDPSNPFLIRDVGSVSNFFIIGGGRADLYRTMDVPHGTVARRWYDSPGLGMDRRVTIYTPPGYETSSESYPVLYLSCVSSASFSSRLLGLPRRGSEGACTTPLIVMQLYIFLRHLN